MKKFRFSIIIRTYNEEKWLGEVLRRISTQNYSNYEVVIVDSESTDNTINICKEYNCKIVSIKKERFNYSYASNVGAQNSSGDILCYLSGHSVPAVNDYLELANEIFNDNTVGGAFGEVIALEDGTLFEKIYNGLGYRKNLKNGNVYEKNIYPGILSCSNAFIKKDIWEKHKFKEELGKGGEDVEMADCILKEGYSIVRSPYLLVKHSHGNGFLKFLREIKAWRIMYADVERYIYEKERRGKNGGKYKKN